MPQRGGEHFRIRANVPGIRSRLGLRLGGRRSERIVLIDVEAFDWNCPKHITPRFTREKLGQDGR